MQGNFNSPPPPEDSPIPESQQLNADGLAPKQDNDTLLGTQGTPSQYQSWLGSVKGLATNLHNAIGNKQQ
jgi:hypothetical protein